MARRLHLSAREMPGELSIGPQRVQARARRHVARMVVTFVIGKPSFASFGFYYTREREFIFIEICSDGNK